MSEASVIPSECNGLTTSEVAKRLNISRSEVQNRCRNRVFDGACKDRYGHWRIPASAIEKLKDVEGSDLDRPTQQGRLFQLWEQIRQHPFIVGIVALFIAVSAVVNFLSDSTTIFISWSPTLTPTATATITPTPLPFSPARQGEQLIVIAPFLQGYGVVDLFTEEQIQRTLREAIDDRDLQNVRVEIDKVILNADALEQAIELNQRYNAAIVVWGEETQGQIIVNIKNFQFSNTIVFNPFDASPDFPPPITDVTIKEREFVGGNEFPPYQTFILTELPSKLTFFSLYTISHTYYLAEQYEQAASTIEDAISYLPAGTFFPGLDDAYVRLGWIYDNHLNQPDKAIESFKQSILYNSNNISAYNNLAVAYTKQNNFAEAIESFKAAIALDPANTELRFNLGVTYLESGNFTDAISEFDEVISKWSDVFLTFSQVAYDARGEAHYLNGDFDLALNDFNKSIDIATFQLCKPEDLTDCHSYYAQPQAYFRRGLAYEDLGKLEEALTDYNEAIQQYRDNSEYGGDSGFIEMVQQYIDDLSSP